MRAGTAKRVRIIFDADERLRLGLRLAATAAEMSTSDFLCELLRKAIPREIQDAGRYLPKKAREVKADE